MTYDAPTDEVTVLREIAREAQRVMDALAEYKGGIVGHLLDTDDNAGEFLRQALSRYADIGVQGSSKLPGDSSGSSVPGPAVQPAGLTAAAEVIRRADKEWAKMAARSPGGVDLHQNHIARALDAAGLLASPQPPEPAGLTAAQAQQLREMIIDYGDQRELEPLKIGHPVYDFIETLTVPQPPDDLRARIIDAIYLGRVTAANKSFGFTEEANPLLARVLRGESVQFADWALSAIYPGFDSPSDRLRAVLDQPTGDTHGD